METRATYTTDREMNIDPRPDIMAAVAEAVAAEAAAVAETEADGVGANGVRPVTVEANADEPQPSAPAEAATETVGAIEQLETLVAAQGREIADLRSQLAEAQQRAALPPLTGNPAPATQPGPTNGYAMIRAAIEQG